MLTPKRKLFTAPNRTHSMRLGKSERNKVKMPILFRAHRNRCVGKFGRALTMGRPKYRALRSTRRKASVVRVRSLHIGEGLSQFACRYTPRDRSDEASGKIPHLPSEAPLGI